MEKFGIFELLDALSALTVRQNAPKESENTPPAPNGSAYEGASDASANAAAATPAPALKTDAPRPAPAQRSDAQAEALSAFLARHDALSKKAGSRDNPHK